MGKSSLIEQINAIPKQDIINQLEAQETIGDNTLYKTLILHREIKFEDIKKYSDKLQMGSIVSNYLLVYKDLTAGSDNDKIHAHIIMSLLSDKYKDRLTSSEIATLKNILMKDFFNGIE